MRLILGREDGLPEPLLDHQLLRVLDVEVEEALDVALGIDPVEDPGLSCQPPCQPPCGKIVLKQKTVPCHRLHRPVWVR